MRSVLPALVAGGVLACLVALAHCSQSAMHRMETRTAGAGGINSSANRFVEAERMREDFPDSLATRAGWRYQVLAPGEGPAPIMASQVRIHYRMRLRDDSVIADTRVLGEPLTFALGTGEVIRGLDMAVADMRPGERRLLLIPYRLGYGVEGRPPDIPPRATLILEVELIR